MKKPHLILVSGPPGAGKSTLSLPLAQKLCATHIDKDCIDEPFSPNSRGPYYSRHIEPKVLMAMLHLANLNLKPGRVVILDVPWTHILINSPIWVTRIRQLVKNTKSQFSVVECVLEKEALRARLIKRGLKRDRPKLTKKGWQLFLARDRIGARNPFQHFRVSVEDKPEKVLKNALKFISRA